MLSRREKRVFSLLSKRTHTYARAEILSKIFRASRFHTETLWNYARVTLLGKTVHTQLNEFKRVLKFLSRKHPSPELINVSLSF